MRNYATSARTEFIIRELHSIVDDPGLYNWEEVWDFLLDHGAIFYDPASETFHWNDASYYRLTIGVLYNLIDSLRSRPYRHPQTLRCRGDLDAAH